jgi:hypothetical protein
MTMLSYLPMTSHLGVMRVYSHQSFQPALVQDLQILSRGWKVILFPHMISLRLCEIHLLRTWDTGDSGRRMAGRRKIYRLRCV